MKNLMNFEHRWKLRDWIDINRFDFNFLSSNPNAMLFIGTESRKDWLVWII